MLDDAFISLMKTRTEKDSRYSDERVVYLLSVWEKVKSAPDIPIHRYDGESEKILSDYIRTSLGDSYYDYRTDPWYGYSAPYTDSRDENSLKLRLLDSEDMAHDLSVLAEDMKADWGITFNTIREAERMNVLVKAISLSHLLLPSLLKREKLIQYIKSLGELEVLSVRVKRVRECILQYYTDDIFLIGKSFWKGTLSSESVEYSAARERIEKAKKDRGRLSDGELRALTELVLDYRKARRDYRKKEVEISPSFSGYSGWKTDWKTVREDARTLLEAITERDYGVLTSVKTEEWEGVKKKAYIFHAGLNTIWEKYNSSFESLLSAWDGNVTDLKSLPLSSLEDRFHSLGESDALRYGWKNAAPIVREAEKNGISTFLDEALSRHISPDSIIPAFRKALVKKALNFLYSRDENLKALMERNEEEKKEEKREDSVFALCAPLDLRREAASFSVDSFASPSFGDFMKSVVDREGPVFDRDLMKRLSFLGGEEYLTPQTVESYKRAMESLEGVSFVRRGGFVYPREEREYPFRRASLMRDFSHIAPEELKNGMETIIRMKGEIGKGDLYNTIGSFCGYSVVLKSRYPELDRILLSIGSVTVEGDTVKAGGVK